MRVKTYNTEGEFETVVAGPDQLGWVQPLRVCKTPEECKSMSLDIAIGPDDRVYVLDTMRGIVTTFEEK